MSQDNGQTLTAVILPPKTIITHYIIEKVIGTGATGVVYLAHDSDLDRKVALKFLSKNLRQDQEWRSRFLREAQAIAQLNHPNIVTIYEVGEYEGQPFIAMEHVEGGSLDDYISTRRLTIEEALELAIQISDGLSEAHSRGIIHRDIKPTNILVSQRGRAKIVDFGLAALLKKEPDADLG
jgi:serine/threonine protein kinase